MQSGLWETIASSLQKAKPGCDIKQIEDKLELSLRLHLQWKPRCATESPHQDIFLKLWGLPLTDSRQLLAFSGNLPTLKRATLPKVMP